MSITSEWSIICIFWFGMEGNLVFKTLYSDQSPCSPAPRPLTWVSAAVSYLPPTSYLLFSECLSQTTRSLCYGKPFTSNPLCQDTDPSTWWPCKAFYCLIVPVSPVPPVTNLSPHPSCLTSQPQGSTTPSSLPYPALIKNLSPLACPPRLSVGINFSRKTLFTPLWIWCPSWELPQALSAPVFSIHHKETQYSFTCLSPLFR